MAVAPFSGKSRVTDKTLITKTRRLLWLRITHKADAKIKVYNYQDAPVLSFGQTLTPRYVADQFRMACKKGAKWKTRLGSHERIIVEAAKQETETFDLHYYSIGLRKRRLASYFIVDTDARQKLPGHFDWQAPVILDNIEVFFGLKSLKANSRLKTLWEKSTTSFKTSHHFTIVLRLHCGDTEFLGLDCQSELHQYPYGRLVGGLPFGAEDKFLSMCIPAMSTKSDWERTVEVHKQLFNAWNVICRKDSGLARVFIEGEPGSGKELWFESIRNASQSHRPSDNWKTLSATLPTEELKSLLYGQRNGALERQGFLASCAGGGIFLDEIGKSDKEFRRDLLRVLEAKEFVPIGGLPTALKDVLFIFASTRSDRERAYDPPDFWTRMDVELLLPAPITLEAPNTSVTDSHMSSYDEGRFFSLLAHFWLVALQKKQKQNRVSSDADRLLASFRQEVFEPIVNRLAKVAITRWPHDCADGIAISPRRVQALATTIASEYQWVGYKVSSRERKGTETAKKFYADFMQQFVDKFFEHLVRDAQNKERIQ